MPAAFAGLRAREDTIDGCPRLEGPLSQISEADTLRERGRICYVANRLYHGTTEQHKKDIQQNGFKKSRKIEQGKKFEMRETRTRVPDDPGNRHYFARTTVARLFAVLRGMEQEDSGAPALVRTIGVERAVASLELDPDMGLPPEKNVCLRTPDEISAAHVLGSKKRPPTEESAKIFQSLLDSDGVHVSEGLAGELFQEYQSDSEEDFPQDLVERYTDFWREKIIE